MVAEPETAFNPPPDTGPLFKLGRVCQITGLSAFEIERLLCEGRFPRPTAAVPTAFQTWRMKDILAWVEAHPAGIKPETPKTAEPSKPQRRQATIHVDRAAELLGFNPGAFRCAVADNKDGLPGYVKPTLVGAMPCTVFVGRILTWAKEKRPQSVGRLEEWMRVRRLTPDADGKVWMPT